MKKFKHFALGFLTASVLSCGLVYASQISETIQRTFKDIKIVMNGNQITPKDATGNVVEPFVINGTTYLPVRAICEAIGLQVTWDGNTNTVNISNTSIPSEPAKSNLPTNGKVGLGETFEFDDMEITIGANITFDKMNNQFSEYYKKDVVKIPITIKNIDDESKSLSVFYLKIFGPQGTEVEDFYTYYDDSLWSAGSLRPGASKTTYAYFLYDGNGEYAIEFDNWSNKITVEFNVSK